MATMYSPAKTAISTAKASVHGASSDLVISQSNNHFGAKGDNGKIAKTVFTNNGSCFKLSQPVRVVRHKDENTS